MSVTDTIGRLVKKIFGSRNERILRRYQAVADAAGSFEDELRGTYDEDFAARVAQLDLESMPEEEQAAHLHAIRKELSAPLAHRARELKARLSPPRPIDQLVDEVYGLSDVEKWELLASEGEPLAPLLPEGLRDRAEVIEAALIHGESMQGVIPAEYFRSDLDRWRERLDAGEPLEAVLPDTLKPRANELRLGMAEAEPIEDHLPLAFALVREASRRAQQHRHFPCQLVGGQVLYHGSIAEMKTGEGKTIVCHLAALLKVLQGFKVHIVTVNDYLVKRDAEFARPIFDLLGVSVGYIQSDVDPGGHQGLRQKEYACDITYGTNNEFGFDYLRDNMKMQARDQVQGSLGYVIVDEVDSILIDEARTPLIISGPSRGDPNDYRAADDYAVQLVDAQKRENANTRERLAEWHREGLTEELKKRPKFDDAIKRFRVDPHMLTEDEAEAIGHKQYFVVQLERKQVGLTNEGAELAAKASGLGSFYLEENMKWPHLIENSLRAHVVYEKDRDYVVQNREVIIVDEFTGRLMHGRQWSDGLHQAVEAKHRNQAEIKRESQTLATITLQNYFKLYKSLAGMTGTAMTESDEFMKIYGLEVVAIPTNRPVNRVDHNDKIYKTVPDKYDAIVEEIHQMHRRGRPNDPFLLATILERLKPICQPHNPGAVAGIDEALRQFNAAENFDPKVVAVMLDAYDAAMGDLAMGRPVLVGTTSVENSERLRSLLLKRYPEDFPPKTTGGKEVEGLEVLNAKYHEREAEIVRKAGQRYTSKADKQPLGNVTIATNMAGRGTDIKLEKDVVYEGCKGALASDASDPLADRRAWQERNPDGSAKIGTKCCIYCEDYDGTCAHCWKPKVDPRFPALGRTVCPLNPPCGLHIVGTERHEARRIDNQLRGRSGRQGDPGSSRFFLSLEDDLLKLFMPDWMLKMMEKLGFVEGISLEDRRISKGIERAQKKVEERNFSTRKHLLEWDEPMDYQRKAFYRERQQVLTGYSQQALIRRMIDESIAEAVERYLSADYPAECVSNWCRETLKLDVETDRYVGMDAPEVEASIRSSLLDKARDDVTNIIGEYIDPDLPSEEWDVRGLARWASSLSAVMTENQLRKTAPAVIEQTLIEAAEQQAETTNLDAVEGYLDAARGCHDLAFWAGRKFDIAIGAADIENRSPADTRAFLAEKVHAAYDRRRATFPVEWIIEQAYARSSEQQAEGNRWGHEVITQWTHNKFGRALLPEVLQDQFGGDIQKIGDALVAMQNEYLASNGKGPGALAEEISATAKRYGGKVSRLREWARARFQEAFDEARFDALTGDGYDDDALHEALLDMGREWLSWEFNRFEKHLVLRCYDEAWMDHLLEMDHLKYAIMQRPLGGDQTHPQSQYAIEGRGYFEKMWGRARDHMLDRILRVRASGTSAARSIYQAAEVRHDDAIGAGFQGIAGGGPQMPQPGMQAQGQVRVTETIRRDRPKVKPNEPCPCGSGKKYKKCCGRPSATVR
ncbi:MAG: SEC-C domain-containing protein [Phycisphaerae bacterium]|nr:SEC-C domain-containing protein [Phycisphaerae bacterium]